MAKNSNRQELASERYAREKAEQRAEQQDRQRKAQSMERFIISAERAAAKTKGTVNEVDNETYKGIIRIYKTHMEEAYEEDKKAKLRNIHAGADWYRKDQSAILAKYHGKIKDDIWKEYGPEGVKAWENIGAEMQPESIFTGVMRMFYNTEKGGFQGGGLLGGLGVGALAYWLTSGSGWLLQILGTVAATLVGAYFGGKIIDPADKKLETPNFHERAPRRNAPGQGRDVSLPPASPPLAREKGTFEVHHFDDGHSPQTPDVPGKTPEIKPARQNALT